jgi:uncharacterized SAM-binding protein YcdF (DUF218 family)
LTNSPVNPVKAAVADRLIKPNPASSSLFKPKRWLKYILIGGAVLVCLAATAYLLPHQVLCTDSGPANADAVVVLGGGSGERPGQAAKLFREHATSKIIVSGEGDCSSNRRLLLSAGVPAEAIETECKSTSTKENAQFTIPMLRSQGARRVIIVTSWYHSRRALNCFRHYAPDIQFFSRPAYYAYNRNEWTIHGLRRYIRVEYAKLAGYWVCYGIAPF